METLIDLMKKVLADTFTMYLKAHNFHWNVEGRNFMEYHNFFGSLYEELHGAVDPIAEEIRTLDSYVPGSLKRFSELSEIQDEYNIPTDEQMMQKLLADNQIILNTLNITFKLASQLDKQGLADFLAGRIDIHNKHNWMIKSYTKR